MVRVLIFLITCCLSSVFAAPKPNVLIIYVDDLGYGDTAVYGHPIVKTPNIDSLAAEGIRFTQFYAPSALCSPSRAGLLTGRTPYRTGVESWIPDGNEISLGENEITIAQVLKKEGYRTAVIGKWHLNGGLWMKDAPQPKDFGFDYQYGLAAWVKNIEAEVQGSGPLFPDNMYRNNEPVGKTNKFSAELVTDEAIEWLSSSVDEPFFLYLTYSEVHAPIASPADYTKMYDQFLTEESRNNPFTYYFNWADKPYRGKGEYYANISFLDAQLGRVIGHLRETKHLDNTLVIFSSDNGPVTMETAEPWELGLAGETGGLRGKKRYLFEGGIRVPGIVRYPGLIAAGSVTDTTVTALDVMPTVVEFVGASLPADRPIDGVSLLSLLGGESLSREKPMYWSIPTPDGMEYAIRHGNWKLILDSLGSPAALFNLADDFYEVHNKLDQMPEKVAEMKDLFERYRKDVDSDPVMRMREVVSASMHSDHR
jgi:arylsulfatase A-like enzyme